MFSPMVATDCQVSCSCRVEPVFHDSQAVQVDIGHFTLPTMVSSIGQRLPGYFATSAASVARCGPTSRSFDRQRGPARNVHIHDKNVMLQPPSGVFAMNRSAATLANVRQPLAGALRAAMAGCRNQAPIATRHHPAHPRSAASGDAEWKRSAGRCQDHHPLRLRPKL